MLGTLLVMVGYATLSAPDTFGMGFAFCLECNIGGSGIASPTHCTCSTKSAAEAMKTKKAKPTTKKAKPTTRKAKSTTKKAKPSTKKAVEAMKIKKAKPTTKKAKLLHDTLTNAVCNVGAHEANAELKKAISAQAAAAAAAAEVPRPPQPPPLDLSRAYVLTIEPLSRGAVVHDRP